MFSNSIIYNTLVIVLIPILTLFYCTPILGKPANIVGISVLIAFMLLFRNRTLVYRKNQVFVTGFLFFVILTVVYRLIGLSDKAWGNSMHQYSFFISYIAAMVAMAGLNVKKQKMILWIIVAIMAFNIADNIHLSIEYPMLNENRDSMDEDFLATINAGGSRFYTFAMFYFNVCFFVFLNAVNKKTKYIMFGVSALSAVYVLGYCYKGSNVVYMLLSIVLQLIAKYSRYSDTFIIKIVIFSVVALLLVYFYQDEIVNAIIRISPSERLTTRLVTIVNSEHDLANENTITGRENLILLSLTTWLDNPVNFLFGIGDVRAAHEVRLTGIGQHSDFLDSLARFGILGGTIIFITIKQGFRYIFKLFGVHLKIQLQIIVFMFVLCGFTKGVFNPYVGCVLFLLLPLCSRFVKQ